MSHAKAPRIADFVGHMIDAARRIQDYTAGLAIDQFRANTLV